MVIVPPLEDVFLKVLHQYATRPGEANCRWPVRRSDQDFRLIRPLLSIDAGAGGSHRRDMRTNANEIGKLAL